MKYNSIGEQLIAKAKELDPNYKPDKFNDMSEAIDILLNNSGGDIWLDITPYINEDMTAISQEGYDLVSNAFSITTENPINKYVGILIEGNKLIFNRLIDSDLSNKKGFNFILNITIDGVKACIETSIYNDRSIEVKEGIDSSGKIWYDLDKKSGTITQNQYDEIKSLIDNDSLAGITLSQYTDAYYPLLSYSTNGTITFMLYQIAVEDEGLGVRNLIVSEGIVILPDLAINYIIDTIYTPILTKNLSSQSIISVKTDGYQENLTIGNGLEIKGGALDVNRNGVFKTNTITISKSEISLDETNNKQINFNTTAQEKITNLFTLINQNQNNIVSIKSIIKLSDGSSFIIYMDYHARSAINPENIQGIAISSAINNSFDLHLIKNSSWQSSADLTNYFSYIQEYEITFCYF